MITVDDFKKLEMRVGKILAAERVAGSDKLLKLSVDIGPETRQIMVGIGRHYEPETLAGRSVVIVTNLETRNIMGLPSQGMLLCASGAGTIALIGPDSAKEIPLGTLLR